MRSSLFVFVFLSHMSTSHFCQTGSVPTKHRYDSIFSFGDSLSDTGNLLLSNNLVALIVGKLRYGQTFGYPTGRFSDGRLIVDFIAEEFGVPLLQPYLARSRGLDFRQGANFAVAGATALDTKFLYEKYNVKNMPTNSSLSVQLGWFKELKSSLCNTSEAEEFGVPLLQPYLARSKGLDFQQGANFAVAGATALDTNFFYERYNVTNLPTNSSLSIQLGWFKELKSSLCNTTKGCDEYFRKSLFLVGGIGFNDYLFSFFGGGNLTQVRALVPLVIKVIASTASILIEEGAVELVLPGGLQLGCSPALLTLFQSPNKGDYDPQNGCLKRFNALAMYHNNLLKIALENLRRKYPQAKIIYADHYGAAMRLFQSPKRYGFSNGAISACCGGGGPYNYNASAICGLPGSKVCNDPSTYANWDGDHLTEAAYRLIAKGILEGPYSSPPITLIN